MKLPFRSTERSAGQRGFRRAMMLGYTIIEIMVSMSLLLVIVAGLLATFMQTQRALKASTAQTDTLESGRSAMKLLVDEMKQIVANPTGQTNLLASLWTARPDPGSPVEIVQNLATDPAEQRANRLYRFCFLTRNDNQWTATYYDFREDERNRGVGSLYRFSESTNALRVAGLWTKMDQFMRGAFTVRTASDTNFSRVISGVVHLRVYAYDHDGIAIPSDNAGGYYFDQAPPAALEVEMGVLDADVLKRVKTFEDVALAQSYLTDRAANVQLFRQRFVIPAAP